MIKPYYEEKGIVIYNGDCLEIMPQLDKVDLVLTDTPYGVTKNEWDKTVNLSILWKKFWKLLKENGVIIMTTQQPFTTDVINSERENFRYDIIWYKALGTGFLNANKMPMRNHEHILCFYKKLPTYNPQMVTGKMRIKGSKKSDTTTNYGSYKGKTKIDNQYYPQSVIDFTNGDRTKENQHPTQKPISLMKYLILTYSNTNEVILDPFLGSGTTLVACKELGRQGIGIEISEEYCEIAVKRLKNTQRDLFL